MTPDAGTPNYLVVEGKGDKWCVLELLRGRGVWNDDQPAFLIKEMDGVDHSISAPFIRTQLKQSDLKVLGLIVDADANLAGKWESFCSVVLESAASNFADLTQDGFITTSGRGLRVGFWCMPDCSMPGNLETFLSRLKPSEHDPLWSHVMEAAAEAKTLGAPFKDAHKDKVYLHTWLAWQNPSGMSPSLALKAKTLNPNSSSADQFVKWIQDLYGLGATSGKT